MSTGTRNLESNPKGSRVKGLEPESIFKTFELLLKLLYADLSNQKRAKCQLEKVLIPHEKNPHNI